MRSLALYENFLQKSYADSGLPPLWEVIYQEALRGNHILFKQHDVEQFELDLRSNGLFEESDFPKVDHVVVHILTCADRAAMMSTIESLPYEQRKALYLLYKRSVLFWRNFILSTMN